MLSAATAFRAAFITRLVSRTRWRDSSSTMSATERKTPSSPNGADASASRAG